MKLVLLSVEPAGAFCEGCRGAAEGGCWCQTWGITEATPGPRRKRLKRRRARGGQRGPRGIWIFWGTPAEFKRRGASGKTDA